MKKLIVFSLLLSTAGIYSCKRDGRCTCEVGGVEVSETYEDLDKEEYDEKKDNCEDLDCEWSLD